MLIKKYRFILDKVAGESVTLFQYKNKVLNTHHLKHKYNKKFKYKGRFTYEVILKK